MVFNRENSFLMNMSLGRRSILDCGLKYSHKEGTAPPVRMLFRDYYVVPV
jgi:hypothetical protein